MAQVFAQAIDEALCALLDGLFQCPRLAALVGGFPVHEPLRLDPKAQKSAIERAVVKSMGLDGAQSHPFAKFGITGEDRCLPAGKTVFQPIAELRVQRCQLILVTQPLAIGRIGDQQAR